MGEYYFASDNGGINVYYISITNAIPEKEVTNPEKPIKYGDVDGNGDIDTTDVVIIKKYLAHMDIVLGKQN